MRLQLLNENVRGKDTMTAEQFKKREIEKAPKGEPVSRDLSGVEYLRKLRGVKMFNEMPESTKAVYLQVARCFPGVQVWAVGSRVRGDYVDYLEFQGKDNSTKWQEYFRALRARRLAGMSDKKLSDFDFLVLNSTAQPVCELPENTERVLVRVQGNEMVAIPIFQ